MTDLAPRPRDALQGLALCAGIGGLELGIHLALGDRYRPVAACERDPFAASTLVARLEEAGLGAPPVWDSVETFPGRALRGKVDLLTAGFPCQPFSVAGKRRGTDDERWIWEDIARILRVVRPALAFLENVPGLLAHPRGLGRVLGELAEGGFDAEWSSYTAEQLGAPHRRERVFILAWRVPDAVEHALRIIAERRPSPPRPTEPGHPQHRYLGEKDLADTPWLPGRQRARRQRVQRQSEEPLADPGSEGLEVAERRPRQPRRPATEPGQGDMAEPAEHRCGGGRVEEHAGQRRPSGDQPHRRGDHRQQPGAELGDPPGPRSLPGTPRRVRGGEARPGTRDAEPEHRGRELGDPEGGSPGLHGDLPPRAEGRRPADPWPPGPGDRAGWRRTLERDPTLEPSLRRAPDGLPHRVDRLRALGNAVVPVVAAHAFADLLERAAASMRAPDG